MIRAAAPPVPRRRPPPAEAVVPLAAGAAGMAGLLAVRSPLLALGVGAGSVMMFLPWAALCTALFLAANQHLWTLTIGGLTIRFEQLLLIPFFVRAILLSSRRATSRWRLPEWLLLGFVVFQLFSTYQNGLLFRRNFLPIGLVFFGALAYLTVYTSIHNRQRLILATRVLLYGVAVNAAIGTAAFLSQVALSTRWGVSKSFAPIPAAYGLMFESNIFGSTCAAGALVFLGLWRERNPVFSKRASLAGFAISSAGMVASLTRGAWIGFAVAMVAFLVAPRKAVRRGGGIERVALLVMMLPLLLLAVGYVASSADNPVIESSDAAGAVGQKAAEAVNLSSGTGRGRLVEWQTALTDIKTSPVIGLGTNAYGIYHPNKGPYGRAAYIGNLWVRVLYESGIIGVVLFACFVLAVLLPTRALLFSRGDLAPIARATTFGLLVLPIAYIGTDSTLLMWPWLMIGLTRAARTQAAAQYRASRRPAAASAASGNGSKPGGRAPLGLAGAPLARTPAT